MRKIYQKIILYSLILKELTIPDVAKTVVWSGESLCVSIKKEYYLIDYPTGKTKSLLSHENTETPLTLLLPDQQILLQKESIPLL
jgi:hypothetical protein